MTHENIVKIWFQNQAIYIENDNGKIGKHDLIQFSKLMHASKKQLKAYKVSPFGIHWEELDEDLSFDGFFKFKGPAADTVKTEV